MFKTFGGRVLAGVVVAGMAVPMMAGTASAATVKPLPTSEGVTVLAGLAPRGADGSGYNAVPTAANGRWVTSVSVRTGGTAKAPVYGNAIVTGTVGKPAKGSTAAATITSAPRTLGRVVDATMGQVATDGKAVAWTELALEDAASVLVWTADAGAAKPKLVRVDLPQSILPEKLEISGNRFAVQDAYSHALLTGTVGQRGLINVTGYGAEVQDFTLQGSRLTWTGYSGKHKVGKGQTQSINTMDLASHKATSMTWSVPSYRLSYLVASDKYLVTATPESTWDPTKDDGKQWATGYTLTRYNKDLSGKTVLATHVKLENSYLWSIDAPDFEPQIALAGDRLTYTLDSRKLVQRSIATVKAPEQLVACTPGGGDYPLAIGGSANPSAVAWVDYSGNGMNLVARTKPIAGQLGTSCGK